VSGIDAAAMTATKRQMLKTAGARVRDAPFDAGKRDLRTGPLTLKDLAIRDQSVQREAPPISAPQAARLTFSGATIEGKTRLTCG
jgi:hypothetical protein